MAVERTSVPYPTHGPAGEDGVSWAEYFRNRRAVREARRLDVAAEPDVLLRESGTWTRDGHHRPGSLLTFVKKLEAAGFTGKGVYRTTFEEGGVYGPTADKAGEPKPDRLATEVVYAAVKVGYGYCKIMFEQINDGKWKCVWRNINGEHRLISDKELNGWIKNAN